jgi:DNA primase
MIKLPYRKIILALDPDDAGEKGTKRIANKLNQYKIVTKLKIPNGKDINDLSKEEFDNLQEIFI